MEPSRELDLRGEICPYVFVKTKLALEEMEAGKVLEVAVDHAPAVENVPRSVASLGHHVLEVREVRANSWTIRVRKGDNE